MGGFENVKLLFEYTKFHIGLYTALITALIAALNFKTTLGWSVDAGWVLTAVIFIGVAGLAGGVIASSLPHFSSLDAFWNAKLGPYRFKIFSGESWTYIEHTTFWLGVIARPRGVFG